MLFVDHHHRDFIGLRIAGKIKAKLEDAVGNFALVQQNQVGLDRRFHSEEWTWAFGVGAQGWDKLRQWIEDGGTLVALGDSVETARALCDLPLAPTLPLAPRRGRGNQAPAEPVPATDLRTAFQSPANLMRTLEREVVDAQSRFFCPGSLLVNEFDPTHPVAYGMPSSWPVFFRHSQAYRLSPGFGATAQTVSRYPATGEILASLRAPEWGALSRSWTGLWRQCDPGIARRQPFFRLVSCR